MLAEHIKYEVNLESELKKLALEANYVTNLIDSFKTLIPGLAVKLNDTAATFKSNLFDITKVKELKESYDDIKNDIPHANFINYSNTLVSVPEGFKGDFKEYLKLLTTLSNVIYKEANTFLSEYNFILSDFITNKDSKKSNHSHSALFKNIIRQRELHLNEISDFFSTKSDSSKIKLGSVISRFADTKLLTDLAIDLEKTQTNGNLQLLADGVNKSVSLLNIIKTSLDEDKIVDVSGMTAENISQGAYELAKYIEFVSIFKFKCDQAVAATNNTLKTIKRILN